MKARPALASSVPELPPRLPASSPKPSLGLPLNLSLQFAEGSHRSQLPRHRVRRWLRAALLAPAQITVRVVGSAEGLELNQRFRNQAHATNVLTFDYERSPVVVADLVLCAPVVAAEAFEQGIELQAHYAHLLVHGALHAQGHDHLDESEALAMEARETSILLALGYGDPYARSLPAAADPQSPAARRVRPP